MTSLIDRAIERYRTDQEDDADMPQEPADRDKSYEITIAGRQYVIIGNRTSPVAAYEFIGGEWEFQWIDLWELGFSKVGR